MKRIISIFVITWFLFQGLSAQEGMWLLSQIKDLGLNEKGLEISVDEIYHPEIPCIANAVVQMGGTGSFVSPEGLLLTNHHVALGALQRASTKENDYLTNGYLAKTHKEEIEAPGFSVYLVQSMQDVTNDILLASDGIDDPKEKKKIINTKIREIKNVIEKDQEDISAKVSSMYNGKQYILYISKRFDDVRIVYAPPKSIGKYGGDEDNFEWPRHTGDFTFLRVYASPNGIGRKYHEDNIPYNPKKWLKISNSPIKEDDLTFILGFPGSTTRYRTSNSVNWNLHSAYPQQIENLKQVLNIINEMSKDDPEAKIKLSGIDAGLNNLMKNLQGKFDGMNKTNFLQKRKDFEKNFMKHINENEKLKVKYGDILEKIEDEYKIFETKTEHNNILRNFLRLSGTLSQLANQIYYYVREREKPKVERNPSFSERNIERTSKRLNNRFYSYYEPADKALLKWNFNKAKDLSPDSKIDGLDSTLKNNNIETFVEQAYKNTKLDSVEFAKTLFTKSSEELDQLNDPLIVLAKNLYPELEALRERNREFNAEIDNLRKRYIDALYEWKGDKLYPDANGTIRFTYGTIEGYIPRDAVSYQPFTTLSGMIEKNTGEEPFNAPQDLLEPHKNNDLGNWSDSVLDDVPVNFIHHADITGGNSGSPVMNAKGELVGIAFDGNYEAMTSDWQYDYDLQRAISVDIRYVLFILEKFAKANHILKELEIN